MLNRLKATAVSFVPREAFLRKNAWKIVLTLLAVSYLWIYRDLLTCKRMFSHDSLVWYGTFHYYLENIKQGVFPYWDPYLLTGTPFYPNISGYGLLDPIVLVCALLSKLFNLSPLTLFIYFRLYRIFFFAAGAFLLFRYLSRSAFVAVCAAGMLLFAATVQNNHQPMMDYGYTVPLAFYLLLLLLDNIGNAKRYRILFCLALLTGITMNIFIPTLYLFSMLLFLLGLFLFKRYRAAEIISALSDRTMLLALAACLALVLMMTAPPLLVSLLDTSRGGELFPIAKLVDSNEGKFKVMMASDSGADFFFDAMRRNMAAFLSPGSLLNLLAPDLSTLRFFKGGANALVFVPYMGILALIVIAIGLIHARSPLLKAAFAVTVVLFLSMFSLHSINDTYNAVQRFMNVVFPPLRMIDMRFNFSSVLSFCLCLMLCIATAHLGGKGVLEDLVKFRFRSLVVICLSFAAGKAVVNKILGGAVFLSWHDDVILLLPLMMVLGLAAVRSGLISGKVLLSAVLSVSLLEMALVAPVQANSVKKSESVYGFLALSGEYRDFTIQESRRALDGTEYFRFPYVPQAVSPLPSFIETMTKVKSGLISNSYISIFTTKRYYDLFSQAPVDKQLALNGVMYPLLRFFPPEAVSKVAGRRRLLETLSGEEVTAIGSRLYLEVEPPGPEPAAPVAAFRDLKNVEWFETDAVTRECEMHFPVIKDVRENLRRYLDTGDFRIRLKQASVNEVQVTAENAIDGYLLYSDGWSKYWRAYDGNRELPVLLANYNAKAVFLPAGRHLVRFVFSPRPYQAGLILFYAGLVLSVVAILWTFGKNRPAGSGRNNSNGPEGDGR